MRAPLRDRLFSGLTINPETGCLLWTGSKNHKGYGYIVTEGRQKARVHRLMYEMFAEPIPDGLHLDHLCRVRHCASPAHLEAVTPGENTRRGVRNVGSTHCDSGHEFTEANTYMRPDGGRRCRACRRALRKKSP